MNTAEFRTARGITAGQMIEAIRADYPKYSKITQSMVDHQDEYGVELVAGAEQIVLAAFGGESEYSVGEVGEDALILLEQIPEGKENAISRGALVALTGWSDRTVRKLIQELRQAGYMISSNTVKGGYYQCTAVADVEKQYRTDLKRATTIFRRLRHCRRILKEAGIDV